MIGKLIGIITMNFLTLNYREQYLLVLSYYLCKLLFTSKSKIIYIVVVSFVPGVQATNYKDYTASSYILTFFSIQYYNDDCLRSKSKCFLKSCLWILKRKLFHVFLPILIAIFIFVRHSKIL